MISKKDSSELYARGRPYTSVNTMYFPYVTIIILQGQRGVIIGQFYEEAHQSLVAYRIDERATQVESFMAGIKSGIVKVNDKPERLEEIMGNKRASKMYEREYPIGEWVDIAQGLLWNGDRHSYNFFASYSKARY